MKLLIGIPCRFVVSVWYYSCAGSLLLVLQMMQEPYGVFPPLKGQQGLTPAAEMWNGAIFHAAHTWDRHNNVPVHLLSGRLAMLGIIAIVLTSFASGKDILDVVNIGTGGLLLK